MAFEAVRVADVRDGVAEEVGHGHARDRRRVLEGEEEARLGPLVGLHLQEVDAVDGGRALGHLVVRVARQGVAQGALARAVGAHQGVDLALADRQVDPLEDLLAADGDMQVLDRQHFAHRCGFRPRVEALENDGVDRPPVGHAGRAGGRGLASKSQERCPSSRHWLSRRPRPTTFSNIFRSIAQTARSVSARA